MISPNCQPRPWPPEALTRMDGWLPCLRFLRAVSSGPAGRAGRAVARGLARAFHVVLASEPVGWALRAQPGDRGGCCKGFSMVRCPRVVFCSAVSVKFLCEAQRRGESGFDSISFGTATSHITRRTVFSMGGIVVPF